MAGENRVTVYEEAMLRVKIEDQEGVAQTLTPASVLYVEDLKENIGERDTKTINAVTPDGFEKPDRGTNMRSSFDFKLPWMYSGTPGLASALAPVYRACGGNQIDDPDNNRIIFERARPRAIDTLTAEMLGDFSDDSLGNETAYQYLATGCRGQLGFEWLANDIPRFLISNLVGDYHRPGQVAFVEPEYGSQKTNLGETIDLSTLNARSMDNKDICLSSAKVDNFFGYTMSRPADQVCSTTTAQTAPGKLTLVYALPEFQTHFNPWEYAESMYQVRRVPVMVGVGSVAGKKIIAEFPAVQPGKPSRGAGQGGNTQITQEFKILQPPRLIEA